jgi:hypothetical protein
MPDDNFVVLEDNLRVPAAFLTPRQFLHGPKFSIELFSKSLTHLL